MLKEVLKHNTHEKNFTYKTKRNQIFFPTLNNQNNGKTWNDLQHWATGSAGIWSLRQKPPTTGGSSNGANDLEKMWWLQGREQKSKQPRSSTGWQRQIQGSQERTEGTDHHRENRENAGNLSTEWQVFRWLLFCPSMEGTIRQSNLGLYTQR